MNLLGIKKINIVSSTLNVGAYNSKNLAVNNILTTIPADVPPFSMISYTSQNDLNNHVLKTRTIDRIGIELQDEEGRNIDFNNIGWTITLCISTEREGGRGTEDLMALLNKQVIKPIEPKPIEPKPLSKNEEELRLLAN